MDIEVLRGFAEIVEHGSITAAAKKMYVTQAALSTQLKALEKELNTVLLIRSAHRLELTEAGRTLYKRAKSMIAIENSLRSELHDMEKGVKGLIRIGISSYDGYSVCGRLLSDFLEIYRGIRCEIYEKPDCELLEMLSNGSAGAAFLRYDGAPPSGMDMLKFPEEPMTAIYDAAHISDSAENISLSALSGKRIAVQKRYAGIIENAFLKIPEDPPFFAVSADSAQSVISAALGGTVIGLVPRSAAECAKGAVLRNINAEALFTERAVISAKGGALTSAEKLFINYASVINS